MWERLRWKRVWRRKVGGGYGEYGRCIINMGSLGGKNFWIKALFVCGVYCLRGLAEGDAGAQSTLVS